MEKPFKKTEMNKKFKNFLFGSLVLLFIISVPLTVLYSQGYRFDFGTRKIVQTGGIFLKTNPPDTIISVGEDFSKTTGFLSDSVFVSGLMPKSHKVKIEKEGYHPWTKNLIVEEKRVTEAKNITLFPLEPAFEFLFKEAQELFFHPRNRDIIIQETVISEEKEKFWQIKHYDFNSKEKDLIVTSQELTALLGKESFSQLELLDVQWAKNAKKALIGTLHQDTKQYFLTDFSQEDKKEIKTVLLKLKERPSRVTLNPASPREVIFLAPATTTPTSQSPSGETIKKRMFFLLKNNEEQEIIPLANPLGEQEIISFLALEENLLWLDENGLLYHGRIHQNNLELVEVLNKKPLRLSPGYNYQIIANSPSQVFLRENQALYFLNSQDRAFEKIFDIVREVKLSSDASKAAIRNDHQIWLFFLEEQLEQPRRKKGEKILLSGFEGHISNLYWINSHYLVFQERDEIQIIEIDNRSQVNIIRWAGFPGLEIFWNEAQKTLFAFSQGALYYSTRLLR